MKNTSSAARSHKFWSPQHSTYLVHLNLLPSSPVVAAVAAVATTYIFIATASLIIYFT